MTPLADHSIAARVWNLARDLRVVEQVASGFVPATKQPAGRLDLHVADCQGGRHRGAEGQDSTERIVPVPDAQSLPQVHQPAALGVYRRTRQRKFPDGRRGAGVLGQRLSVELRIATTDVQAIEIGWQRISD